MPPIPAPSAPSEHTVAWVFGQPVTDLPQDLFIPPDALKVVLGSFQGPLDLLLYLIRKQNIDVLDIPMVKITEQYLHYIAQIEAYQFDLAAEYLLMAAMLIEIKSRLLLPRTETVEDEEADPRAELVRRLLAYEQMKLAAQGLDALPRAGRDFAWAYLPLEIAVEAKLPEVYITDLTQAWLGILSRAKHTRSHEVIKETISVRANDGNPAPFERTRDMQVSRPVQSRTGRGLRGRQLHRTVGACQRRFGRNRTGSRFRRNPNQPQS